VHITEERDVPRRSNFEELESRSLLSATIFQHDDIGYFVNASERRLERYDLAGDEWLSPIVLPEHAAPPAAAMIDSYGLYVAYGGEVYRYEIDGSSEEFVEDYGGEIRDLYSHSNNLYVTYVSTYNYSDVRLWLGRWDRDNWRYRGSEQLSRINSPEENWTTALLPELNIVVVRTVAEYGDDYLLPDKLSSSQVPAPGVEIVREERGSGEIWNLPGTSKIVDSSGGIYDPYDTLGWSNFLVGAIDDVAPLADGSLVTRHGRDLTLQSPMYLPQATYTLSDEPIEIVWTGDELLAFYRDSSTPAGIRAESIELADFDPIVPTANAVDPTGLAFTPDAVAATAGGTVLLLSRENSSLFTWNSITQSYGQTVPLLGAPSHLVYAQELDRAYLFYPSGLVSAIDMLAPELREVPLAVLPNAPHQASAVGKYLFVFGYFGYQSAWTLDADGQRVSVDSEVSSNGPFVWSDVNQKAYHIASSTLRALEINARGDAYPGKMPGAIGRSYWSSSELASSFTYPLVVSADGQFVVLASGAVYDARGLYRRGEALTNGFLQAAWLGSGLYSIRELDGRTQVQGWQLPRLSLSHTSSLPGSPKAIAAIDGSKLLVVTMDDNNVPQLHLLNSDLENVSNPVGIDIRVPAGGLAVRENGASAAFQIALTARPSSTVRLQLTSLDPGQITVGTSQLFFTPLNWNVPRTVTLRAVDDAAVDYSQHRLVSVTVDDAHSAVEYRSAPDQFLEVANLDDESVVVNLIEHNGIAYSFIESEARVERYDLATGQWLPSITLSELPARATLAHVDADGLYIAYDKAVYRYNLDGSGGVKLIEMKSKVLSIHSDGNLLFINSIVNEIIDYGDGYGTRTFASIASFSKNTNLQLALFEKEYALLYNELFFPELNEFHSSSGAILFYTDEGIFSLSNRRGTAIPQSVEPTQWLSPDSYHLLERNGDLLEVRHQHPGGGYSPVVSAYVGRLATHVTDATFLSDGSIVVLDGQVLRHFVDGLPVGTIELGRPGYRVLAGDRVVTVFMLDPVLRTGLQAAAFSLEQFTPPMPAPTVDPINLAYDPEVVAVANDGSILLLDQQSRNIFRWDSTFQRYLPSIPLIGEAIRMTYAPATNQLYLAYPTGLITRIGLDGPTFEETPFATVADQVGTLQAVGDKLFATKVDYYEIGYLFAFDGTLLHRFDINTSGSVDRQYVWSESNHTLYTIVNSGIATRGVYDTSVGYGGQTPSYNDYPEPTYPLRVTNDGKYIVSSRGHVYDATTRLPLPIALPDDLLGLTSSGDVLYAIEEQNGATQVRKYVGPRFEPVGERGLAGQAKTILSLPAGQILVVAAGPQRAPIFTVLDADLNVIGSPTGLLVTETNGNTVVREAGGTDEVAVSLRQQPIGPVAVHVSSSNPGEVYLNTSSLVFTPENWNVPQIVTVVATADQVAEGNRQVAIQFHLDSSAGFEDGGQRDYYISVTTIDAETSLAEILEYNGIVYLFSDYDGRVERYDMANRIPLAPFYLENAPSGVTAALVEADGIYVGYGRDLYRFAPDGTSPRHILNVPGLIAAIHVDDDLLFVNDIGYRAGRLLSLNRQTFELIDAYEARNASAYDRVHSEIQPGPNRILGFGSVGGSVRIAYTYSDSGKFTGSIDSYYLEADRAPDFLPQAYDDIAFDAVGNPMILTGSILTVYGAGSLGSITLLQKPAKIAAFGDTISVFFVDSSQPAGYRVETLGATAMLPPASLVHPQGLDFTPDDVQVAPDGTSFLLSQKYRSVFRWNGNTQAFVATIRLSELPEQMAYAPELNSLYVAYRSGRIVKITQHGSEFVETTIATLAGRPLALEAAGNYLVALDESGPGNTQYLFDKNGRLLDLRSHARYTPDYVWNEVNQRLYHLSQDQLPATLQWQEFLANGSGAVQFGASFSAVLSTTELLGLAGVSVDGSLLMLESGELYDAHTLAKRSLPLTNHAYPDAEWIGSNLYSLRFDYNGATVTKWTFSSGTPSSVNYGRAASEAWLGKLPGDRLLFVRIDGNGRLKLEVLDRDLRLVNPPPAQVVGRKLFYNNSKFDRGLNPLDDDDAAIAPDKTAYLPGSQSQSSLQSVSSYSRGINGLMIDIAGNHSTLNRYYFRFSVGNDHNSSNWTGAPEPSQFIVRPGEGIDGSTRVQFIWPDGAIVNTWLRVQIRAGSNLAADVFYFGNLIGETDGAGDLHFVVDSNDTSATRQDVGVGRPITAATDHNKDGVVSAVDILLTRFNAGMSLVRLDSDLVPAAALPSAERVELHEQLNLELATDDLVEMLELDFVEALPCEANDESEIAGRFRFQEWDLLSLP